MHQRLGSRLAAQFTAEILSIGSVWGRRCPRPVFYRYRASCPKRNGSPRNCSSRAGDERSAAPRGGCGARRALGLSVPCADDSGSPIEAAKRPRPMPRIIFPCADDLSRVTIFRAFCVRHGCALPRSGAARPRRCDDCVGTVIDRNKRARHREGRKARAALHRLRWFQSICVPIWTCYNAKRLND
jgi:hypothetical protein